MMVVILTPVDGIIRWLPRGFSCSHYSFTLAELVTKGHLRPLKEASEAENVA
ncbi:hypothetical protein ACTM71_24635 [Citrobacter portucalensis]